MPILSEPNCQSSLSWNTYSLFCGFSSHFLLFLVLASVADFAAVAGAGGPPRLLRLRPVSLPPTTLEVAPESGTADCLAALAVLPLSIGLPH